MEYDALKIRLQPTPAGSYTVLASGPAAEAAGQFRVPFDLRDLENFVLRVGRPRRGVRRLDSPEMDTARTFGSELFEALFQGEVRDLYQTASAEADTSGRGLRITLLLGQAPELMNVPWEYLCEDGRFLSVSERTPIVRYLDLKKAHKPFRVDPPLRIVAMVSSPHDVIELNVDEEKKRLERALEPLIQSRHVEIVWLERATLRALLQALDEDEFHVFHYIGHGAFDEKEGDGVLMLEDDHGRGKPVTGMGLGQLLQDERTLRLAVLNTCEGARTDSEDAFAGVAASLVKNEIPSVVAMQFEITDEAAITFAEGFYSALARGAPLDSAVAAARRAIWADYNDIEWGTPVLFMRVSDGRVFEIPAESLEATGTLSTVEDHLNVTVIAEPSTIKSGEEVTLRLTIENVGKSLLTNVAALRDDGSVLEPPIELRPSRRTTTTWRLKPKRDLDATITVSAVDASGNRLSEQVSTHVTVQEDAVPRRTESQNASEAPVEYEAKQQPGGRRSDREVAQEDHPAEPFWRKSQERLRARPRTLIVAGAALLVVPLVAVVLIANSRGTDGSDPIPPTATLPFEDAFSNREYGWPDVGNQQVGGRYANGAYQIHAERGPNRWGVIASPGNAPSAADVRINVEARRIGGSSTAGYGYGIFCRAAGEDDLYRFTVWARHARIEKRLDGKYKALGPPAPDVTSPVGDDRVKELQAVCATVPGESAVTLELWVDGALKLQETDENDPLETGVYGLHAILGMNDEGLGETLDVEFDNFAVAPG